MIALLPGPSPEVKCLPLDPPALEAQDSGIVGEVGVGDWEGGRKRGRERKREQEGGREREGKKTPDYLAHNARLPGAHSQQWAEGQRKKNVDTTLPSKFQNLNDGEHRAECTAFKYPNPSQLLVPFEHLFWRLCTAAKCYAVRRRAI